MPTFTALTTLTGLTAGEALGADIENIIPEPTGVGVFEIEDGSGLWEVGAYFTEKPDEVALDLLAALHGAKPFAVSELPETDWVAHVKRELTPVRAGRFFVYGSHDADQVPLDTTPLLIEAAMAFGTGHHGTTEGCLTALDRLASTGFIGKHVIDVGCGTAVLAMAAAKLWPGTVLASDIDEVATDVAHANVKCNDLDRRVDVVTCAGFDHPDLRAKAPFDLILANILKGPLLDLAPDMERFGAEGAHVILSGILNPQAEDVIETYGFHGFDLLNHSQIGEWSTLHMQKRNRTAT
ncbi:ribosomal protein L11 methyltransferase [Amylibacter marinus]|uniref:Ribosomal protein L11 methyltransferase n=1 Tax=Amylibacter marinus TaxID=1475483 RepID=A0ABQ5VQT6_9RHOB|nr:50S ribosomal protein L11 methyltransferase [Amylibacter marinus]GLQ33770.1 ribosomal protein L11 methyltransferase [Amylibacter marinus]